LLNYLKIRRKIGQVLALTALLLMPNLAAFGQSAASISVVDGTMIWDSGSEQGQPVALFGVNYAVPFAYSYRALQKRGIDHKAAIDMDVAHMARLGLDAYRVHVWDRQISDQQGNLLVNEHLELFDYLLLKLAEHKIRVIITPIAWWGSGYPEPDPDEPGFSSFYSKAQMNQNTQAIKAQHNYLKQFFSYINPYTQQSYGQDPNIVAIELFNEPRHEDGLKNNESYIEGLAKTVRELGIKKPLFYNISEQGNNPDFARRLCSTSIDGVAYQWYPAGLVKNSELASNLLSSVAHYQDPFADITGCKTKVKMVYEFDAADTAKSVMYPAMARSFKEAGFQWATQFAYDPAAIADTNSDYNTHYLNLLYTPSKAISFMIAAQVFRQVPLGQKQDYFPQNNHFTTAHGKVELDYAQDTSVLLSPTQFLYSNATEQQPASQAQLSQIAGVGSSPLVNYQGSGAYFLDKVSEGNWRLEVYPDVLTLQDPYQSSSLKREVARLYSKAQKISILLKELGKNFMVSGLNEGNKLTVKAKDGAFTVLPGVYLLSKNQIQSAELTKLDRDYLVPQMKSTELAVRHQVKRELSLADKVSFMVQVGSAQIPDKVELAIKYRGQRDFTTFVMQAGKANTYQVSLPKNDPEWLAAGQLEYGFVLTVNGQKTTFPGAVSGSPHDWDFVATQAFWQSELRPIGAPLTLFDALADRATTIYPNGAKSAWKYVSGEQGQGLALQLSSSDLDDNIRAQNPLIRLTLASDNQINSRNLQDFNTVAIKVRAVQQSETLQFSLLDRNGLAHGIDLDVGLGWQYLLVPISALQAVDTILPQSYPMFMSPVVSVTPQSGAEPWYNNLHQLQGMQFAFSTKKGDKKQLKAWRAVEIAEVKLIQR
jgi:hypothetical protein